LLSATRLARRIIVRLAEAEAREPNPHYRDDLQIAKLTVKYASTGEAVRCTPHELASYMVLGVHPDKVWPKILERRRALGITEEFAGGKLPPKKPPRPAVVGSQQKLWLEKTSGARATNSRADNTLLRDNTISVPMAAPSIAALFPNPDQSSSAKKREFTLDEIKRIVGYSGAPHSICALTISALRARGEWPNENGPATTVLSVAIIGMMLEGVCCRRTVQRRIKRALNLGYWRRVRDANSWTNCPQCGAERTAGQCGKCTYKGRSKTPDGKWTGEFLRVPVYEFDVQKFQSGPRCREIHHFGARTYAEYKSSAKLPNVIDMGSRKPAQSEVHAPAPPTAHTKEPQRKTSEHQRSAGRSLGPSQRRELAERIEAYEQGRTAVRDGNGYLVRSLNPGAPNYIKPLPRVAAVLAACESMDRGDPKWGFAALRIPKIRSIEAAIEMGEVIPSGGNIGSS
jgi:hypothetical protein